MKLSHTLAGITIVLVMLALLASLTMAIITSDVIPSADNTFILSNSTNRYINGTFVGNVTAAWFNGLANNSNRFNGQLGSFYQNADNLISGGVNSSTIDDSSIGAVDIASTFGNTTAQIQTVINANPTGNTTAQIQTVINANPTGNTTAQIQTVINNNPTGNTTAQIQTVINNNPTGNTSTQIIAAINGSTANYHIFGVVNATSLNATTSIALQKNNTDLYFGSENRGFIRWNSTCDCLQIGAT